MASRLWQDGVTETGVCKLGSSSWAGVANNRVKSSKEAASLSSDHPTYQKKNLSNIQYVKAIPYKLYYVPCVSGGGGGGGG